MRRLAAALVLLAASAAAFAQDAPKLGVASTLAIPFEVADSMVLDTDGDGVDEYLLVGTAGQIRVFSRDGDGAWAGPFGDLDLDRPERSLLAPIRLAATGGVHLLEVSSLGLRAYPVGDHGAFARRPLQLAKRATFTLRVGVPRFAPVARDVNGDGREDVLIPRGRTCEIWLRGADEAGQPRFARAASVVVDVRRVESDTSEALTDVLEAAFTIPDLVLEDVNGDGRQDVVVAHERKHAFHLQREDGSLPAQPDIRVDLELFRDTTPEGDVRLGRTLAGQDTQRMQREDLDGDGIPDFVISHRRKVWVFHGGPEGPQFSEPSTILKVADDITWLQVLELDDDGRPDLALVRIEVPTAAGLLRGLVAEWGIEISTVGYRNDGKRGFERTPTWRGELSLRLPAILGIIRNPERLLQRFENAGNRFRDALSGDLDGDGAIDVVTVDRPAAEGDPRASVWLSAPSDAATEVDASAFRDVLFPAKARDWDIDQMLEWMGNVGDSVHAARTGGRVADVWRKLRTGDGVSQERAELARRPDGGSDVLIRYRGVDGQTGALVDVLRLRR